MQDVVCDEGHAGNLIQKIGEHTYLCRCCQTTFNLEPAPVQPEAPLAATGVA